MDRNDQRHRLIVCQSSDEELYLPEAIQKSRALQRDKTSVEEIEKIINTQVTREERLRYADDVMINDGTILELKEQVLALDRKYRLMAKL